MPATDSATTRLSQHDFVPASVVVRPSAYWAVKRVFDTVVSFVLLVVTAPLLLVLAVLVRLDSPGPALFRQTRVGRYGRPFTCLKIRTLVHGADERLHRERLQRLIAHSDRLVADPIPDDPRVTRVGAWLRRTGLDELPQLWNVLRGDMSIVGPRPAIPYEVSCYAAWQTARLKVRPGITGYWQVFGRHMTTFDEACRMDLEYISRPSMGLDVKLFLLTPVSMTSWWRRR